MSAEQIVIANCAIELVKGDITCIPVDAIVNAANRMLAGGGGVDGAIHDAAGPTVMEELRKYGECPTGNAVVTGAGLLPARYIFHAVGPVYQGGNRDEAKLLASCYRKAIELGKQYQCRSISFPSISTGVYGYPIAEAASVALSAIAETLNPESGIRNIKLVQFSEQSFRAYSRLMDNLMRQQAAGQ